jgi:hypothetical protein
MTKNLSFFVFCAIIIIYDYIKKGEILWIQKLQAL